MTIHFGSPYWWEHGAALPDLPETPPANASLAIIGAGYTGLSAALFAARQGVDVVVLEAGVPGIGASTRNGGMFGAHPRLAVDDMIARHGEDVAEAIFRESVTAYDWTRNLIADEGIDCDLQVSGRIQLAWSRAHFEDQKRLVAELDRRDAGKFRIVERAELHNEISTDRYFGGILFESHAGLHPRKFHDGLLAAALKAGVRIVQNCPVVTLQRSRSGFHLETPGGTVRAGKVIAATNGYTKSPLNWLSRRVFPLPSFIVATEPLSPNLISQLAPGRRMMVETRARHSYFRISPDGSRILWGGRAAMTPTGPQKAADLLRNSMEEIWPALKDVKLTHSWTGNTGFAFNHTPHVGVRDGLFFAVGYSGSGVAMAPYLGMKAAARALGHPEGETAFAHSSLATRIFHPGGRPWFLVPGQAWYSQVVDRREASIAARDRALGGFTQPR